MGSLGEMVELCPDSEGTHSPPNWRVSRHIGSPPSHGSLESLWWLHSSTHGRLLLNSQMLITDPTLHQCLHTPLPLIPKHPISYSTNPLPPRRVSVRFVGKAQGGRRHKRLQDPVTFVTSRLLSSEMTSRWQKNPWLWYVDNCSKDDGALRVCIVFLRPAHLPGKYWELGIVVLWEYFPSRLSLFRAPQPTVYNTAHPTPKSVSVWSLVVHLTLLFTKTH